MADDALRFTSEEEFTAWMETNHRISDEVWLAFPKKGTNATSITRSEALDVALCYGWIDGKAFSGNTPDGWWAQRFTPRRPRSSWSKINRDRVEALTAAGKMRPAGVEQVDSAKADGRWAAAYAPPSTIEIPEDLRAALSGSPAAAAAFDGLNKSTRYQILLNIEKAVKPETRARRIATYVDRLSSGESVL